MSKKKKIALIYEGIKSEKELLDNVNRVFFCENTDISILSLPADGNIYMLWERLVEDEFETDLINVLKEMNPKLKEDLQGTKVSDFSEVYLFFDFDIHNNNLKKEHRNKDVIEEMLKVFNNETELGKLYISYPMIESIKDISYKERSYKTFYIDIEDSGKYKSIVALNSDYSNYKMITRDMWLAACDASRKQAGLIKLYKEECGYEDFLSNLNQKNIYDSQKNLFLKNNKCIAILNAVPLFLLEYYKKEFWDEVTNRKSIYIFGAHSRARTLAVYLTELYPNISVEAFLTDNTEENPTEINDVPVLDLYAGIGMADVTGALNILHTDTPVFIGTRGVSHMQISEHLRALGFSEIYPVTVELDLQLRNDFLKCYFAEQGRCFEKIDGLAEVSQASSDSNDVAVEEGCADEVVVYVAKSIFDKSLMVPYELASYEKEIQVGAALTEKRLAEGICVDNVGDNISHKNKQYCELTALYWIWKNATEDVVGLVHYRRHFILPDNWQQIMVERGIDVILPVPLYVDPSLEVNYKSRHDGTDLDYLFEYVRRRDEAEYQNLKNFFGNGLYSPCNMFIMRKDVLHDLCGWIFPLLEAVVEHGGQKEDSYLNRYPGFLSERLISYFFEKNRDKYKLVYADKNFLA